MRIREHHLREADPYQPQCDWGEDVGVQWGDSGIVLSEKSYLTAFFEAFPPASENCGGFIRGEGDTVEDAERDCFQKYVRQSNCDHLWGREKYRNSGQLCRHCRAFRCGHVKPVVKLGEWRRPISRFEDTHLRSAEWMESQNDGYKPDKWIRKLRLQKSVFGVEPDTHSGVAV